MSEMGSYFKRIKVPLQNRRPRENGDTLPVATSSLTVAQNRPDNWARFERPPFGQVVASAVRESTCVSGPSINILISDSVEEPSCSLEERRTEKDRLPLNPKQKKSGDKPKQKVSRDNDLVKQIRLRIKNAEREGFIAFEDFTDIERVETRKEEAFREALRVVREGEHDIDDPKDGDYVPPGESSKKGKPKPKESSTKPLQKGSKKRARYRNEV